MPFVPFVHDFTLCAQNCADWFRFVSIVQAAAARQELQAQEAQEAQEEVEDVAPWPHSVLSLVSAKWSKAKDDRSIRRTCQQYNT